MRTAEAAPAPKPNKPRPPKAKAARPLTRPARQGRCPEGVTQLGVACYLQGRYWTETVVSYGFFNVTKRTWAMCLLFNLDALPASVRKPLKAWFERMEPAAGGPIKGEE
jgi:hypothetical protein